MTFREQRAHARAKAAYRSKAPSLTDQSGAHDSDINIIVGKYLTTGRVPGAPGEPLAGDWTQIPRSLRDAIHVAKGLEEHRRQLPAKLRNLPINELIALTPDTLTTILTPPANPPAPKETK